VRPSQPAPDTSLRRSTPPPARCIAARTRAGGGVDRRRGVSGAGWLGLGGAGDREAVIWNGSVGSAYVRGSAGVAWGGGAGGELHPGPAGHTCRSDGGLAI